MISQRTNLRRPLVEERDREALRSVPDDCTCDRERVDRIGLASVRTVETHHAHIQQKLRLSSRSELVRYYALEHKLVTSEG